MRGFLERLRVDLLCMAVGLQFGFALRQLIRKTKQILLPVLSYLVLTQNFGSDAGLIAPGPDSPPRCT